MRKALSGILNLPWSLLGVMRATLGGIESYEYKDGVLYISVRKLHLTPKGTIAITAGRVILYLEKIKLDPEGFARLVRHELVHIEQQDRTPLIWPLVYSYETGLQLFRNRRFTPGKKNWISNWLRIAYLLNRFEVEAREREK